MKFALVSVFLLASFAVALSLKCYTCTKCSDNGKETTCPSGMDKCLKSYGKQGDDEETTRRCSNQAACDLAKTACDNVKDGTCEIACCDSDLCNAAAAPSFSVLVVSLCFLFAAMPFFQ